MSHIYMQSSGTYRCHINVNPQVKYKYFKFVVKYFTCVKLFSITSVLAFANVRTTTSDFVLLSKLEPNCRL